MAEEPDEGFHINQAGETPIAHKLLISVNSLIAGITPDTSETERGLIGHDGYTAGAIAELERRLGHLEELVRGLMAR